MTVKPLQRQLFNYFKVQHGHGTVKNLVEEDNSLHRSRSASWDFCHFPLTTCVWLLIGPRCLSCKLHALLL